MTCLRFLPQATLDGWVDQGKVDVIADHLIDQASKDEFPMREALHFVKLESGTDAEKLLRKVKSIEAVRAMGAEHYMTSVILGDDVYQVEVGWLAEESTAPARAPSPAVRSAPKKESNAKEHDEDADMLAKLLLDKLQ
jgi:hypothetical protein